LVTVARRTGDAADQQPRAPAGFGFGRRLVLQQCHELRRTGGGETGNGLVVALLPICRRRFEPLRPRTEPLTGGIAELPNRNQRRLALLRDALLNSADQFIAADAR